MASITLQPPEPFEFKKTDTWLWWQHCFNQFRIASGLAEKTDQQKVSILSYCLGESAEDILVSTNISEEKSQKIWLGYSTV